MKKVYLFIVTFQFMILPSSHAAQLTELHSLLADIEKTRIERDIPSISLTLVNQDGIFWTGTFGFADRDMKKPADSETMYRIGSVTKLFTGIALIIAQAQGLLRLHDPVKERVPDFPVSNRWHETHPVRIEQLLEHTAGLPEMSREEFNHNTPMSLHDALYWKADTRKTLWPPGLHSSYTNVGAGLAAWVLEQAAHENYEAFVEKRLFTPLDMKSATFYQNAATKKYLATGYDGDGHTIIPYWHVLYRAFGGINIRPAEMAPLIQMLLNRGSYREKQILTEQEVERIETPETTLAARSGLRYGYGLGNYTWLRKGIPFHGHGGDADGYLSRLGYNRDRNMGYFIVINVFRNDDLTFIRHRVEDFIIGGLEKPEPPVARLPATVVENYIGIYQAVTSRFNGQDDPEEIEITAGDGGLVFHKNGRSYRLLPVTEQHFRYPGETMATAAFVRDETGHLYFQDDSGNFLRVEVSE